MTSPSRLPIVRMSTDIAPRWPTASRPGTSGRLRVRIEDFIVRERRERSFDEEGEHLYLLVERAGLTTRAVQSLLSKLFAVPLIDVGYAGMKDKWAVVTQWFSIRLPKNPDAVPADRGIRIVERHWHGKKLKVGDLDGNAFEIVVRETGDIDPATIEAEFPNYFGVQRFGADGANIGAASAWIEKRETRSGRRRIPAFRRSIYLSTLRSLIFNDVLAGRVDADAWRAPIDGDVCVDGLPTGPLWGRGRSQATGSAAVFEATVVEVHATIAHGLEFAGLGQDRRALVAKADELAIEQSRDLLGVSFVLPKGSYATTFLNELVDLA